MSKPAKSGKRNFEALSGSKMEPTELIPDGFRRLELQTGQEWKSSANCEVQKLTKTMYGESWVIKDLDQKIFKFIGVGTETRDRVLGKYTKGMRLILRKFKQFINVLLTQQNEKIVVDDSQKRTV